MCGYNWKPDIKHGLRNHLMEKHLDEIGQFKEKAQKRPIEDDSISLTKIVNNKKQRLDSGNSRMLSKDNGEYDDPLSVLDTNKNNTNDIETDSESPLQLRIPSKRKHATTNLSNTKGNRLIDSISGTTRHFLTIDICLYFCQIIL